LEYLDSGVILEISKLNGGYLFPSIFGSIVESDKE
jgi:hypothetical protein